MMMCVSQLKENCIFWLRTISFCDVFFYRTRQWRGDRTQQSIYLFFVTNRPVQHCTNHNVAKYTDLICSSVLCCIDYALIILAKPSPYILKPGVIGVETLQIIYWTKKQVQNVCILCRSNTNKNTNTHTHKGASSY